MNVYLPGNITDMQGPCASGFHVPMKSEWEGVKTIMDGLSMTADNWRVYLHLPIAGNRSYSNGNYGNSNYGYYWTATPYPGIDKYSYYFINSTSNVYINQNRHGNGCSIRPFKDGFVTPDASWTVIQGTLGSAGIFRDTVNGLISITSNGTTGYTIADKNLGATTVYNDGDTLSEANCGKFYQWGNNYGFAWTGSVATSSTQVNAGSYGPGNYYSSSTFITGNDGVWDSSYNFNLRGGVTGESPAELKNAYIGNGLS